MHLKGWDECRRRDIRFCSIFDQLVDEANQTRHEYISSDNVHLSQHAASLTAKALIDAGILKMRGAGLEVDVGA